MHSSLTKNSSFWISSFQFGKLMVFLLNSSDDLDLPCFALRLAYHSRAKKIIESVLTTGGGTKVTLQRSFYSGKRMDWVEKIFNLMIREWRGDECTRLVLMSLGSMAVVTVEPAGKDFFVQKTSEDEANGQYNVTY